MTETSKSPPFIITRGGRIPLAVKIPFTLFMMVLVPFYWYSYGPTVFLYFCDMAMFLTLAALWLESPLLASMPTVGIVIPQLFWVVDFLCGLSGTHLTGMTDYMFKESIPLFARGLSLFHGWLPFLLLWLMVRLGYDRRALGAWTILSCVLLTICYLFMPAPPAPADNPNLSVNINYVYGLSDEKAQTWLPQGLYWILWMISLPALIFLPTHLILRKVYRPARKDELGAKLLNGARDLVHLLAKWVLSLRYRLEVQGLEQLDGLQGPVLILPNHPGYIDPTLLLVVLWPRLRPRPVLYENNFMNPVLYPFMKLLNALRVPDLETASVRARDRAQQAVAETITALRNGENVILWPAGRIQRGGGVEALGGTRAVSDILQAIPDVTVVLVRTRGVWGSRWSYAWTGERPSIFSCIVSGIGWLCANLLFFSPRRPVTVTVERCERNDLPEPRRAVINPWLENWFNVGSPETPTFIPYHHFLGPRSHEYPRLEGLAVADLSRVKAETKAALAEILADKLGRPLTEAEQQPETTLDQLGLDSLDRMELTLTVEQRFGFSCDQAPATLGQFWALAQGLIERGPQKPPPPDWFHHPSVKGPLEFRGDTLAAAFVAQALAHPGDVVAADDLAGVLTYERLLVGALAMARRFAKLPTANVGLMLPSSVASDTAFLALHLAGKLPVVLNWTTGPAHLAHAARTMELTHVITSRKFIDRSGVTVEGVDYLFLEEMRQDIGRWELLRTLLMVWFRSGSIRRRLPKVSPDQPAVVLFTSGSERAPKAVPLTHANLLSDQRSGAAYLGLTRQDSMLGFLPAFHSFGMTATMLLPILGGMRVIHHSDPTDASGLTRKITAYRPTVLLGTPTFVSHILDRAKPEQLASLRMIVVGAEKCPPSLHECRARVAPAACLLEGYGITECAPVVAVNRPAANRPGSLGQPLPGVEVCVVDLEDDSVLPANRQGMLLVSGPTVFPGYLAHEGPSPFRERDGRKWYVTGDLARIDDEGYIWFAGRLKRFLKAGGEMISLPALEEPFARLYPPTAAGPSIAVEGVETPTGRQIVLFSTEAISLKEANTRLQGEGFRGIMRLDEVRLLPSIPVLGTGKTDYKALRALIAGEMVVG